MEAILAYHPALFTDWLQASAGWQFRVNDKTWFLQRNGGRAHTSKIVYGKLSPQPVMLWIPLGGKPKWLPLNFGFNDVTAHGPHYNEVIHGHLCPPQELHDNKQGDPFFEHQLQISRIFASVTYTDAGLEPRPSSLRSARPSWRSQATLMQAPFKYGRLPRQPWHAQNSIAGGL